MYKKQSPTLSIIKQSCINMAAAGRVLRSISNAMILLPLLFLFSIIPLSCAQNITNRIGINYGTRGDNLLSPYRTIQLLQSMNVNFVKIYDSDPETLKLLSGTSLRVSIMLPNQDIPSIALDQSQADRWVESNILPYYPQTKIRLVMVGNEVWTNRRNHPDHWSGIVPAMRLIRNSLRTRGIYDVKLGTPLAMDILEASFPPSSGTFRTESLMTVIPLLQFLSRTGSYLFLNVYPYFSWAADPAEISLNFALFKGGNLTYTDPGSGLVYSNLLDQMLDSVHFAMTKLGFADVRIAIAETGWPNDGGVDEPGANPYNAATYNRNLVKRMMVEPPVGTPARPMTVIPTFLFSLYDENLKGGRKTERHWGMVRPDGTPVYDIDMTGVRSDYGPMPEPDNNRPYQGKIWCVVGRGADLSRLGPVLADTCNQLNSTCNALGPGGACYEPVSEVWHASYAFSAYWALFRGSGATCYFNGLAYQTTNDPSHGSCQFPSVIV